MTSSTASALHCPGTACTGLRWERQAGGWARKKGPRPRMLIYSKFQCIRKKIRGRGSPQKANVLPTVSNQRGGGHKHGAEPEPGFVGGKHIYVATVNDRRPLMRYLSMNQFEKLPGSSGIYQRSSNQTAIAAPRTSHYCPIKQAVPHATHASPWSGRPRESRRCLMWSGCPRPGSLWPTLLCPCCPYGCLARWSAGW